MNDLVHADPVQDGAPNGQLAAEEEATFEVYEEIVHLRSANEKLRDIIRRRLACDGSNGIYDARLHLDMTAEMRTALASPNDEGKAE